MIPTFQMVEWSPYHASRSCYVRHGLGLKAAPNSEPRLAKSLLLPAITACHSSPTPVLYVVVRELRYKCSWISALVKNEDISDHPSRMQCKTPMS